MRLYLMRHGETDWNKEGRIQGSADIKLNQNGIDLAYKTLEGIEKAGIKFDYIYSSPYIRALKTAQILSKGSVPIETDQRIREMDFGKYEGIELAQIATKPEYKNMHRFFVEPDAFVPEEGMESYEEAFQRIDAFYQEKIAQDMERYEHVLIVCHGAIIRSFIAYLCHKSIGDLWNLKQPNCALNIFEITKEQVDLIEMAKIVYDKSLLPNRKYT
ncbi:histidine phosphatase family protein [Eubacterium oxidoreducens]|uniref:phosphoglycerate mutase (2,3-diphosphoglycerate-dependent) n=1 Tax=Eubacterium oxidoreducens TaxID=1732 RepID=A0A1G6AM30_EUBOX|nr:histidine phosphatase family protein [Eubacterium oxidoreducens]SDB09477.1 probable phosphoglycerate mutase [Eubacterium oxidoreducens]